MFSTVNHVVLTSKNKVLLELLFNIVLHCSKDFDEYFKTIQKVLQKDYEKYNFFESQNDMTLHREHLKWDGGSITFVRDQTSCLS